MPRIKAVTDANGTKFYPSSITQAVYDIDRNQRLPATLSEIFGNMQFEDIFVGVSSSIQGAMISGYHHNTLLRGERITQLNGNGLLYVVLPADYTTPVVMMSGFEVPMTFDSTVTSNDVSYKVWKSVSTYQGTFNLYLF